MGFQQHGVFDADGARHQVLVGRERRLLGRDQAGVDLLLQQRVVARDLLHAGRRAAVGARVADMAHQQPLPRNTASTSVVPMPAYCGLELAALKMARLALSTQMSIARRTSASLAPARPRAASGRARRG
jgi:hypothetical protein